MTYQETESEKQWNKYNSMQQAMRKECLKCWDTFSTPEYACCDKCRKHGS